MRLMHLIAVLCAASASASACAEDHPLPVTIASSRYIEYSTWLYPEGIGTGGSTAVCMDDKLAEMDRFVERVSQVLDVGAPRRPIRYVYVPQSLQDERTWGCSNSFVGCFVSDRDDGLGVIYGVELDLWHELVHAVEVTALGRSHPMLEEGMATYLGEVRSSEGILAGFPEAFKAEWEPGVVPDYLVAMHFVGSLLTRGTMDQYKALRRRVGYRATLAEFASTYEAIYGEELDLALEAMSKAAVSSVPGDACVDSDVLSWTEPDALLTTLAWQCGDGGTYGIDKAFAKVFALEISTMGDHDFTVTSPEPVAWGPSGVLAGCPGIASTDLSSYRGGTSEGQLAPGRHTLKISMNPGPDMKGELHLELRREPSP